MKTKLLLFMLLFAVLAHAQEKNIRMLGAYELGGKFQNKGYKGCELETVKSSNELLKIYKTESSSCETDDFMIYTDKNDTIVSLIPSYNTDWDTLINAFRVNYAMVPPYRTGKIPTKTILIRNSDLQAELKKRNAADVTKLTDVQVIALINNADVVITITSTSTTGAVNVDGKWYDRFNVEITDRKLLQEFNNAMQNKKAEKERNFQF